MEENKNEVMFFATFEACSQNIGNNSGFFQGRAHSTITFSIDKMKIVENYTCIEQFHEWIQEVRNDLREQGDYFCSNCKIIR